MQTKENGLRETALSLGLEPMDGGYYGPGYGIERGPDGLLRAVASNAIPPSVGVTDDVAVELLVSWCPDADEMHALTESSPDEAANEAACFVGAWNLMAPGEAEAMRAQGHDARTSANGPDVRHRLPDDPQMRLAVQMANDGN